MNKLFDKQVDTFTRKNKDYGNSFEQSMRKHGNLAYVIRAEDKINRIQSLMRKNTALVVDEKVEDTVLDLINYTAMRMAYQDENKIEIHAFKKNLYDILANPKYFISVMEYHDLTIFADVEEFILSAVEKLLEE